MEILIDPSQEEALVTFCCLKYQTGQGGGEWEPLKISIEMVVVPINPPKTQISHE